MRPATRKLFAALLALVSGLTLTGCPGKDKDMQPTDTQEQAVQRVDELVHEAFDQLPAGATLKFSDGGGNTALPCDDSDVDPDGRVFIETRYHIEQPLNGDWPADQALPTLVSYWQQRGYRVYHDGRDLPDPRYVVEAPDDYSALIQVYVRSPGNLDIYLSGGSPCIWPNGTPEAK